MDDNLTDKISQLLGSPEGMQKIQSTLAALGMDGGGQEEAPSGPGPVVAPGVAEAASSLSLPGGLGGGDGLPDMQMIAKLAPLLSGMKGDDDNTRLLQSLRPFLSGDREGRLDESIKIMRMMKMLPMLREQNLF
ncbi:MAG: hypothetical protein HFJ79_04595 [Clostridiales bacterium]|jgi:hypothetical protein|nr:hypothetical protein [Clostridiales bacterium]